MADLDPTKWPKWQYHLTLPATMVATPEAEAALPDGYRDIPYSDEEKAAALLAATSKAQSQKDADLAKMQHDMEQPATPARRRH